LAGGVVLRVRIPVSNRGPRGPVDDDEARKQIFQLRNQVEARQKASRSASLRSTRLGTLDSSARTAVVDLAQLIESLKQDVAKLRGRSRCDVDQTETLERRQKDLRRLEQPLEKSSSRRRRSCRTS